MATSTLNLAPALAFDAVNAFDGDDLYGMQVKTLTAIVTAVPMSSRKIVAWIHETTGSLLSQSTVTRALSVATALMEAEYPLDGDTGVVHSTVANLVRIKIAKPEYGGGKDGLAVAVGFWTGDVTGFCSDVAAYWETVTDSRDNLSHDDSTDVTAESDTEADSGAGEPDEGAVGGGESSIMSADKAADILREIAGNVTAGRMAPTDDLISAAQSILTAAVAAMATLETVAMTSNTGALETV